MKIAAKALLALAAISFSGCRHVAPPPKAPPPLAISEALTPSPRLIVGRVVAVDLERGFAFVALGSDAPPAALEPAAELIVRTPELRETGRLQASRYVRGRTLGATIIAGKPGLDDEVVWLAP